MNTSSCDHPSAADPILRHIAGLASVAPDAEDARQLHHLSCILSGAETPTTALFPMLYRMLLGQVEFPEVAIGKTTRSVAVDAAEALCKRLDAYLPTIHDYAGLQETSVNVMRAHLRGVILFALTQRVLPRAERDPMGYIGPAGPYGGTPVRYVEIPGATIAYSALLDPETGRWAYGLAVPGRHGASNPVYFSSFQEVSVQMQRWALKHLDYYAHPLAA